MKRGDFVVVKDNLFEGKWLTREATFPLGSVGIVLDLNVEDDEITNGVCLCNLLARDTETANLFMGNFAPEEVRLLSGLDEALSILNKDCSAYRGILSNMRLDDFNVGDVVYVSGYRGDKIGGPKQVMFPIGTPGIIDAILPPDKKDTEFMLGVSIQVPKNFLQFINFRCAFYPEELAVIHPDGEIILDCIFEKEVIDPVIQERLREGANERIEMGKILAKILLECTDKEGQVLN